MEEIEQQATSLDRELWSKNLAKGMDKDRLLEIGEECRTGFEEDLTSCSDWFRDVRDWIDLAKQSREDRNYPWPNSSNVKYPLISTASMQFSARAYPALVPSNGDLVKGVIIGKDPTGEKFDKAQRVAKYMSYQILKEMDRWEEDMDRLLMQTSVVGCMFKKTYYDRSDDKIISKIILPTNLVVNYWTQSLEDTERVSEIIRMSQRVLKERQLQGIYLDIDLGEPNTPNDLPVGSQPPGRIDGTTPYEIIEQHTFLDLKDSGYAHPVIVTFERLSGRILCIQNRYRSEDVIYNDKNKIVKIRPWQCYTKFGMVPNPDGSFYDIGFGVLLGPINEAVNTIINQLVDAGTLSNLQSGFIGKGLRLRQGDNILKPGEWKSVNAVGDDLKKQIVPLPAKEPSKVLFELMGTLVTSGKELASVAEIFTGKMPGQNTPATTTMATVEQGMKVFTAVYKRIFRSLQEEFYKIYYLNSIYLDPNKYVAVLDDVIDPSDFNMDNYDICPGADPTATSGQEKLQKAMANVEVLGMIPGLLDPIEVMTRVFEAQEQPNFQKLFSQEVQASGQLPPPPPDPKIIAMQMKAQTDQQKTVMDLKAKQQEMELDARDSQMQMMMKQQEHAQEMQMTEQKAIVEGESQRHMAQIFASTEQMKGQQKIQQSAQAHEQKMQQTKEQQALQAKSPTKTSKTGGSTKSPKPSSKK